MLSVTHVTPSQLFSVQGNVGESKGACPCAENRCLQDVWCLQLDTLVWQEVETTGSIPTGPTPGKRESCELSAPFRKNLGWLLPGKGNKNCFLPFADCLPRNHTRFSGFPKQCLPHKSLLRVSPNHVSKGVPHILRMCHFPSSKSSTKVI